MFEERRVDLFQNREKPEVKAGLNERRGRSGGGYQRCKKRSTSGRVSPLGFNARKFHRAQRGRQKRITTHNGLMKSDHEGRARKKIRPGTRTPSEVNHQNGAKAMWIKHGKIKDHKHLRGRRSESKDVNRRRLGNKGEDDSMWKEGKRFKNGGIGALRPPHDQEKGILL